MFNKSHQLMSTRNMIMLGLAFVLGVGLALTGMSFVAASPDQDEGDIVAIINGHEITREAFMSRLEADAGHAVLSEMISELLILQAEERDGINVSQEAIDAEIEYLKAGFPSDEAFIEALELDGYSLERLEQDIRSHLILLQLVTEGVTVTDEEVEEFFEQNKESLREPETLRVRHILVDTEEEADEIVQQLNSGADFATLAMEKSVDNGSAPSGGMIGLIDQFSPLVEPFKQAAFLLEAGQTSPPVQSIYGWHIIRVDERNPEREAVLEDYADLIREHLKQEKAIPTEVVFGELTNSADINIVWTRYQSLWP